MVNHRGNPASTTGEDELEREAMLEVELGLDDGVKNIGQVPEEDPPLDPDLDPYAI